MHCAAGYRASIAASMLAAGGRGSLHVDDDFDRTPARAVGRDGRVASLIMIGPGSGAAAGLAAGG